VWIELTENIKEKIFSELGVRHFNSKKNMHDIPKKSMKQIDIIFEMTGNSSVALHVIMIAGTNATVVLASMKDFEQGICDLLAAEKRSMG
jgi:hypothetical protein